MALFQASIFSESKYESDQPVTTSFKLTNLSQEPMRVLKWFTPLEGMWSDCLLVIRDGERVPYDGPLAKRGTPTPDDFVTLPPGQSVQTELAVHEAYQVSTPGTYSVSADTEIQAVPVAELALFSSLEFDSQGAETALFKQNLRQPISDAATNFVVAEAGPRVLTAGERVREAQFNFMANSAQFKIGPVAGSALAPQFNGGTPSEQTETQQAHFDGYALAQAALSSLKNNAPYAEWFGLHSQTRFQVVHDHYSKIISDMEQKPFTYDLTGQGCRPGVYAYTYKNTTTIWMCDQFWKSPATGTDSKAGTIVHEHSHASSGTDDLAYGQGNCRQLAISDPDKAVRNADSHEYYAKG